MNRNHALTLLLAAALPFTGCKKIGEKIPFLKKKETAAATPAPVIAAATPAPEAKPAAPAAPEVNTHAAVMALCYHRFEDPAQPIGRTSNRSRAPARRDQAAPV